MGVAWKVWKEVMIWCCGKEVTRDESWRGLLGSEEVIERRREAEDMMVVKIGNERR